MNLGRRKFLKAFSVSGAWVLGASLPSMGRLFAADDTVIQKVIPSSGEKIPALGLGSWITFDAGPADEARRKRCQQVVERFLSSGGRMIDSSPMYGYAQDVIGSALRNVDHDSRLFSATKVWIPGASLGEAQMDQALKLWGLKQFDLVHVHNMLDWQGHLPWLQRWKEEGKVRYLGITTSHGRRHGELAEVIRKQPFNFVQFTYNMADRKAEEQLLALAHKHGKAVVINRPFRGGDLFRRVQGRPLPSWASSELNCTSWAQFFLAWVISHPSVSCAIPATSNPDHLDENMEVLRSPLANTSQRARMLEWFLNS
jgi:diketogulonate reductase-like aldo/keto reductase